MSKAYDSYNMLAKLLNSGSDDKVNKAYDALMALTDSEYARKREETERAYDEKRNALARNKAKADKYLNYFMVENGYENSGIEADARAKASIGYASDLANIGMEETAALNSLESEKNEKRLESEYEKNKIQSENEAKRADILLEAAKIESDIEKAERDEYWKSKEYELDLKKYEGSVSDSSDGKEDERIELYRKMLYEEKLSEFNKAETYDERLNIYNSVTGVNTEKAGEVFGTELYGKLLEGMRPGLEEKRLEEKHKNTVFELYGRLLKAGEDSSNMYFSLLREARYAPYPGFTEEQVKEAYNMLGTE